MIITYLVKYGNNQISKYTKKYVCMKKEKKMVNRQSIKNNFKGKCTE